MRTLFSILSLLVFCFSLSAQTVLVSDSFTTTTPKYVDITATYDWGPYTTATPGFLVDEFADDDSLKFNAVTLTDSVVKYSGYVTRASTKAGNCIDYYWPATDRKQDTLTVEFDVLWSELSSGGNDGRLVIALMHQIDRAPAYNSIFDTSATNLSFGRPAYSFRILNRSGQGNNNYANMMYGGGKDTLGEFERFKQNDTVRWWLPGFISGPGGIVPEGTGVYPVEPVTRYRQKSLASDAHWHHFRWELTPTDVRVFFRKTKDSVGAEEEVLYLRNPHPDSVANLLDDLNNAHGTSATQLPTNYNWINDISGLRFFMNNQKPSYLANVQVMFTGTIDTSSTSIADLRSIATKVFPNPTYSQFTIQTGKEGTKTLTVMDLTGRTVLHKTYSTTTETFPTEGMPSGVYILRLEQAGSVSNHRLVVDH